MVTLLVLNAMINRARARGEHFAYHELDEVYSTVQERPSFLVSVIPLAVVFAMFVGFGIRIEYALAAGCVVATGHVLGLHRAERSVAGAQHGRAVNSINPLFTVGAIVGFAGIVTSTQAFTDIVNGIVHIPLPPVAVLIICVAITCALTGGSSTGLIVCLPVMAPIFIDQLGLDLELIHRVSTYAGTILDTLPYSGSILMLLPICHMKLKEVYPAMFVTTVLSTFCGTVVIALVMTLFPMLP